MVMRKLDNLWLVPDTSLEWAGLGASCGGDGEVLEISQAANDELALNSWLERTRRFLADQSPAFAGQDEGFQRDFVAVQLGQVGEFGLESDEALPTLALTSWYLGLAHLSQMPALAEVLNHSGSEAQRLANLRDMTGRELEFRARAGAALQ